ncbi:MAG: hypothetical protein AAF810_21295 [Cyanobacteria bacterium P01_D01_bin.36]
MVTFASLEQGTAVKMLADGSLAQLYRSASFPQAGATELEGNALNQYFQINQDVTLSMPLDLGEAQDYDPRSDTDATTNDTEHLQVTLQLEKVFTRGYKVYSSDANIERYTREYSATTGGAIRKSIDNYFYNKAFRTWSLAASGDISLGGHPPIALAFSETSAGVLNDFSDSLLLSAGGTLASAEVPEGENRFARLSTRAAQSYLGSVTPVTGAALAQAQTALGTQMLMQAPYMSTDFDMRGFMIRGSNAITGQTAVADTGDGNATEAIGAISAAAGDDEFFDGTQTGSVALGALRLTITQTANLAAGVAVGKIARLGADSGAATAYGVILRVDAASKYVWLVPYNSNGEKLTADDLSTSTDKFGVPKIGSVNVGFHRQHLAFATRLMAEPGPGEGAIAERAIDEQTGMIMQVFKGSYNVHQFKSGIRSSCLCGAKPTDFRKGVLMLSN